MSKTVVVYNSKYGYTKTYAREIAKILDADIFNGSDENVGIDEYDIVIFGGGLYAGTITNAKLLKKIKHKLANKKLVLFTVGLLNPNVEANEEILNNAVLKAVPEELQKDMKAFFFWGGIDYKRLTLIHKTGMKGLCTFLKRKPEQEKTDDDREIISSYGGKVDHVDVKMVEPLVEYVRKFCN